MSNWYWDDIQRDIEDKVRTDLEIERVIKIEEKKKKKEVKV
jgi:hypothetical protein